MNRFADIESTFAKQDATPMTIFVSLMLLDIVYSLLDYVGAVALLRSDVDVDMNVRNGFL